MSSCSVELCSAAGWEAVLVGTGGTSFDPDDEAYRMLPIAAGDAPGGSAVNNAFWKPRQLKKNVGAKKASAKSWGRYAGYPPYRARPDPRERSDPREL